MWAFLVIPIFVCLIAGVVTLVSAAAAGENESASLRVIGGLVLLGIAIFAGIKLIAALT